MGFNTSFSKFTLNPLQTTGAVIFGEANDNINEIRKIAQVIMNRAVRMGVSPDEVVSNTSEFNAYGGSQYDIFFNPQSDPGSANKIVRVNQVLNEIRAGKIKGNSLGEVMFSHDPATGQIKLWKQEGLFRTGSMFDTPELGLPVPAASSVGFSEETSGAARVTKKIYNQISKSFPVQLAKTTLEAAGAPYEVISYPIEQLAKKVSPEKKYVPSIAGFAAMMLTPGGVEKVVAEPVKTEQVVSKLVGFIRGAIREARPLRVGIEEAYTAERAIRFPAAEKAFEAAGGGEAGARALLGALKGPLVAAEEKVTTAFEPVKKLLAKDEIDHLFNAIFKHPLFDTGEKTATIEGLRKILTGEIPQVAELAKLEDVFGSELVTTIQSAIKLGLGGKIWRGVTEVSDIARSMMATADLSGFLRQGIIYTTNMPIKATKALGKSILEAFSPKVYEEWFTNVLAKDEWYPVMKEMGLEFTKAGKLFEVGAREEKYRSAFLQKIPILRDIINASERAYSGFLNKARVDMFKAGANKLVKQGYSPATNKEVFTALADVMNVFTGRGRWQWLERNMNAVNKALFAPRFTASRIQALNPHWYIKQPKAVRMIAIKSMAESMGVIAGIAGVAAASGLGTVELNPLSSDFMKIRVGDTRYDLLGGYQQPVRYLAQFIFGRRKTITTGEIVKLPSVFLGRLGVGLTFIRSKLAPIPGLVTDVLAGQTLTGEELDMAEATWKNFEPMFAQDVQDALYQWGPEALLYAGVPSLLGVGVSTYKSHWQKVQDSIKKQIQKSNKPIYPPLY